MAKQNILTTLYDMVLLKEKAFVDASKSTFFVSAMIILCVGFLTAIFSFIESALFSLLFPQFFGEFSQGLLLIQAALLIVSIPITIIVLGISFLIGVAITWGAARLLGGVATFETHFNGFSYFLLLSILASIPLIGWIILLPLALWSIVMQTFFVKKIHSITTIRALLAVLTPLIIVFILALIIGIIAAIFWFVL